MSPQLNNMFYGFFPHSWGQHMRGGGYRPLVFLEHGLRLGIFMAVAVLATIGYFRSREGGNRASVMLAALWLFGTLILCKSAGALIIASLIAPVILLLGAPSADPFRGGFCRDSAVLSDDARLGTGPDGDLRSGLSSVVSSGRMASLEFASATRMRCSSAPTSGRFSAGAAGAATCSTTRRPRHLGHRGTWVIVLRQRRLGGVSRHVRPADAAGHAACGATAGRPDPRLVGSGAGAGREPRRPRAEFGADTDHLDDGGSRRRPARARPCHGQGTRRDRTAAAAGLALPAELPRGPAAAQTRHLAPINGRGSRPPPGGVAADMNDVRLPAFRRRRDHRQLRHCGACCDCGGKRAFPQSRRPQHRGASRR